MYFVRETAKSNGYTDHIGFDWMQGFLRRNPHIKNLKGLDFDTLPPEGAVATNTRESFAIMDLPSVAGVKPENRYYMSEIKIIQGLGNNRLLLRSSKKKSATIQNFGLSSWITTIECI